MNETTDPRPTTKAPGTLNMTQAARAVGVARSIVSRDIQRGKLSATRDAQGRVWIKVKELEQVYGKKLAHSEPLPQAAMAKTAGQPEVATLREQLRTLRKEKDAQQAALQQEIRALQAQIASLRQAVATAQNPLKAKHEHIPPSMVLTEDESEEVDLTRSGVFRAVLFSFLALLLAILIGFLLVLLL